MISYERMQGLLVRNYIDEIMTMRLDLFASFPYLYKGSVEKELEHLSAFAQNPQSTLILAKESEKVIGISTGLPLDLESGVKAPVEFGKPVNLDSVYYYGEIMVEITHQGLGISRVLVQEHDKLAKELGYQYASILTVIRNEDHPLKPKNYKSTDSLWPVLGFEKVDCVVSYEWPTIQPCGKSKNQQNKMQLWLKRL